MEPLKPPGPFIFAHGQRFVDCVSEFSCIPGIEFDGIREKLGGTRKFRQQ
jgi:hypothetical protein